MSSSTKSGTPWDLATICSTMVAGSAFPPLALCTRSAARLRLMVFNFNIEAWPSSDDCGDELRPIGHDDHHRQICRPADDPLHELERGRIDPVRILEQDQDRTARRQQGHLLLDGIHDALLLHAFVDLQRRIALPGGNRQQSGHELDDLGLGLRRAVKDGFQLVELVVRAVRADDPCRPFELPDERIKRAVHVERRAEEYCTQVTRGLETVRGRPAPCATCRSPPGPTAG